METRPTRSELQYALACEDVSEGLREVIDDLWQRVERVERLLADHYHAHTGTPHVRIGEWPNRGGIPISDAR